MMKRVGIFLIIGAVLAAACMFFACEQPDTVKNVTVTFVDPLNVVNQDPITVEQGQPLGGRFPAPPADATVGGVVNYFYGWFEGATEYDDGTPIGANITLRASWRQDPPDYVQVSFTFTQTDDGGDVIQPRAQINPVKVIKGKRLGISQLPVTPKSKGWVFDAWYDGVSEYDLKTVLNDNKVLAAHWTVAGTYTVTFDSGTGGAPVSPITVYQNECIDEWEVKFPPKLQGNTANVKAFFVAWMDDEEREYDGRVPITRDIELKARWGLPPYIVDFNKDFDLIDNPEEQYGNVEYKPTVKQAWDSTPQKPKLVIVNETTYEVPYNLNRWRILYRIKMKLPSDFNLGFYTRYTIRARFYANKQGAKSWTDKTTFVPTTPAEGSGYNKDGLLHGSTSPSDDGWGQISWTMVQTCEGESQNADTMLQRYNLDRKGGTINDPWAPLHGKNLKSPPFLLIQTSDAYIGHIEVTQIVFHNGEKKYTMYEDEEGYDEAEDGLGE